MEILVVCTGTLIRYPLPGYHHDIPQVFLWIVCWCGDVECWGVDEVDDWVDGGCVDVLMDWWSCVDEVSWWSCLDADAFDVLMCRCVGQPCRHGITGLEKEKPAHSAGNITTHEAWLINIDEKLRCVRGGWAYEFEKRIRKKGKTVPNEFGESSKYFPTNEFAETSKFFRTNLWKSTISAAQVSPVMFSIQFYHTNSHRKQQFENGTSISSHKQPPKQKFENYNFNIMQPPQTSVRRRTSVSSQTATPRTSVRKS